MVWTTVCRTQKYRKNQQYTEIINIEQSVPKRKRIHTNDMKKISVLLIATLLTGYLTGCAGTKKETYSQRGWIGGEYVLSKPATSWVRMSNAPGICGNLPKSVQDVQKSAVQITGLSTNAPAYAAGLRKGDFVTEVDHQRVTSLTAFRRAVDRSKPGTTITVRACHDGRFAEYQVPVGLEKYKNGGCLSLVFPTVVHRWDLWPDPGFSLVCIGYEPNPGTRQNFGIQRKATDQLYDESWSAYLVFLELSSGQRVVSQEPAVAAN